jgi:hypothetical protein
MRDMTRRFRTKNKANHIGTGVKGRVERLKRAQSANFDNNRHCSVSQPVFSGASIKGVSFSLL